jgi:DNA-binding GntR family transcriptional regulator
MSGKIAPGDQIVESECAKTFNVSRTPVREAIGQLRDEGLVEYIPHVGTFVKIPTMEDIKEVYGAYIALSDLLVKHAMNRVQDHEIEKIYQIADEIDARLASGDVEGAAAICSDIHEGIWKISGQKRILKLMDSLPTYWKHQCIWKCFKKEVRIASIRQHRQFIDLLKAKDFNRFKALFADHMKTSCANCIEVYEELCKQRDMHTNHDQEEAAKQYQSTDCHKKEKT